MRGGSRITTTQITTTASIIQFIKKIPAQDSHYGRRTSGRRYLSPELSIAKLWRLWKSERESKNLQKASLAKFKKIFYTKFNLSFTNPKVDICSICEVYKNRIAANIESDVNEAALALHKANANLFYQRLKESKNNGETLTITFDMQQNQPLPKTNVAEAYYSRQLWLYNFTIVVHGKKYRSFTYTWLESDSGKGSNEVTSALQHFFDNKVMKTIQRIRYKKIELFCDSCPEQNKNAAMLCFLVRTAHNPIIRKYITEISIIYPIKGHSYMPPDRVFGRIEKKLRKMEVIKTPAQYQEFFEQEGTVYVYGDSWAVYDYKSLATTALKNLNKLKMQSARMFVINPRNNPNIVEVSQSYAGSGFAKVDLIKPNVNILVRKN